MFENTDKLSFVHYIFNIYLHIKRKIISMYFSNIGVLAVSQNKLNKGNFKTF